MYWRMCPSCHQPSQGSKCSHCGTGMGWCGNENCLAVVSGDCVGCEPKGRKCRNGAEYYGRADSSVLHHHKETSE